MWHRNRRRLHYEVLEDRRVLSASADIVFVVDETGSAESNPIHLWLEASIAAIDASLRSEGINDIRYGVTGFGTGHSFLVDQNSQLPDNERLFSEGTNAQGHLDEISQVLDVDVLQESGGVEDGWEAIEFVISEYAFREGAVPVVVLVQGDEGRTPADTSTISRIGALSALESKGALFTAIVPGYGTASTHQSLFDMSSYGTASNPWPTNHWVLGVEADAADGTADGQHQMHVLDTAVSTIVANPVATALDALQISFKGSSTGATGMVGTGKSILIERNPTWTDGIGDNDVQAGEFGY